MNRRRSWPVRPGDHRAGCFAVQVPDVLGAVAAAQRLLDFPGQLDRQQRVPLRGHARVDHQRVQFRPVVGERPVPEPVHQLAAVRGIEHVGQFPVPRAGAIAEGEGDEVDVVVAKDHGGLVAERADQPQRVEGARAPVHQVADEPELVPVGLDPQARDQAFELVAAALDVTDGVDRHALGLHRGT